jgi:hypothetical protein
MYLPRKHSVRVTAVKGRIATVHCFTKAGLECEPGGCMTIAILSLCVITGWTAGRAIARSLLL